MNTQRDIISEMAKVYRIEIAGKPGCYYGIIVHKPSGQRLEMAARFATDSAANLATRAHLTGAVKRGEKPLA
jgi:hypothetical protein